MQKYLIESLLESGHLVKAQEILQFLDIFILPISYITKLALALVESKLTVEADLILSQYIIYELSENDYLRLAILFGEITGFLNKTGDKKQAIKTLNMAYKFAELIEIDWEKRAVL
ncbi:hypothetical protein [Anabaena catenula]|uniref:Uncharacterized protein n=1 Tax=Anabaena catenula FACHB-362 TaxID=2692877 RepID=A0ABR8J161_9NOST|nr:hypothetical protein [Anabaena catenula]MBD2691840.1 hypothetical protein [Anabaena catenula FACHB-362]